MTASLTNSDVIYPYSNNLGVRTITCKHRALMLSLSLAYLSYANSCWYPFLIKMFLSYAKYCEVCINLSRKNYGWMRFVKSSRSCSILACVGTYQNWCWLLLLLSRSSSCGGGSTVGSRPKAQIPTDLWMLGMLWLVQAPMLDLHP